MGRGQTVTRRARRLGAGLLCCALLGGCAANGSAAAEAERHTATTVAMDTMVEQRAYGPNATAAMTEVNRLLADYEDRLSLYSEGGDIACINAAAGQGGAEVQPHTAQLLEKATQLSAQSEGAFAITVAPLTLAWGVTSESPRVPPQSEIDALLPLVDDGLVEIEGDHVALKNPGMKLDLGGIAKGAVCELVADIYEAHGVESAWFWIGGNVYVHGVKPDGSPFSIGFADPGKGEGAFIAAFEMTDEVIAVSGGYERYFEEDGHRYIHIIDPRTGRPAESDIVSVGVIHPDGATADFWSTTLFVWGRERTLEFMKSGAARVIMLANDGTLYVSRALEDSFRLTEDGYSLEYV